jgi:hypothetical protein
VYEFAVFRKSFQNQFEGTGKIIIIKMNGNGFLQAIGNDIGAPEKGGSRIRCSMPFVFDTVIGTVKFFQNRIPVETEFIQR